VSEDQLRREGAGTVAGPLSRSDDMDREIGPIGTWTRVAGGLIAIALPIALSGIEWWDAAAGLVALPLIALVAGEVVREAYVRVSPQTLARSRSAICSWPACSVWAIVIAAALGLDALTPASEVGLWLWLGASLLVAAARGYAGCEVLAFPNLIRGRREQIGCMLYGPIDGAEARRRAHQGSGVPGMQR
jgi:hypothetical protein